MKKLLLSICAMCTLALLATNSYAQSIQYGAKVGASMSSVSIDMLDGASIDKDMRTSLQFGVFGKLQMSSWFALQAEVLYSMQGAKLKWTADDKNFSGKMKLNYITIPVLAKFYMYQGVFLELGPQVAFLVKKESEGDLRSLRSDFDYRKTDLDVAMGLGYEFDMGLMVGARYNMGTIDVLKDIKSKNGVIQVYAGWEF